VFAFIINSVFIAIIPVLLTSFGWAFVGSGSKYNNIGNGQKKLSTEKPAKAGKLGKY